MLSPVMVPRYAWQLTFTWSGPGDATKIERAFSKSMADQRKEWLRAYDPQAHVDHSRSTLDYSTFIDKARRPRIARHAPMEYRLRPSHSPWRAWRPQPACRRRIRRS